MEQINIDFKNRVSERLIGVISERANIDQQFYKYYGISAANCLNIRLGRAGNSMQDNEWLRLARKLGLFEADRKWNPARTEVFEIIEEDILFCKQHAKAKICVDECGIGKTFTAKYLSKSLTNCFYVDASQGKTTLLFTQILAKAIGLPAMGKHNELKEDIKCYLQMIDMPMVIIDEAGDLGQNTLQDIKEFWNATEGFCGWYLMGADGLKYIMERGMKNRKPGFKEIFSRFSDKYTTTVPLGKEDRIAFYRKLVTDVLEANMADKSKMDEIVKKCLVQDSTGQISGLRRAESLMILYA
jgi:hypothetical protein